MPPKKEAEQRGLGHFFKVLTVATAAAPPAEPEAEEEAPTGTSWEERKKKRAGCWLGARCASGHLALGR